MKQKINIIILVDVIGALSDETLLNGNLAMMDNGDGPSTGQGTPGLVTACAPGQTIQWTVKAVDLQTPVDIKRITFVAGPGGDGTAAAPDAAAAAPTAETDSARLPLDVWAGVVPPYAVPGGVYKYRVELQMYEGKNSIMSIDSCALKCVPAM